MDALVERGLLVLRESALPALVGTGGCILRAVQLPLLEAVVVGQLGAPERVLEVGEGVGRAQEVLTGRAK